MRIMQWQNRSTRSGSQNVRQAATGSENSVARMVQTVPPAPPVRAILEEIYFAVSKIRGFHSLRDEFERECTAVLRDSCPRRVYALWMHD